MGTNKLTQTFERHGLNPPISYFGGKSKMVEHILPLIPPHVTYVEPFVGGGSVFWAKPTAARSAINDINANVVAFYRVLRNAQPALCAKLDASLFNLADYEHNVRIFKGKHMANSDLERAMAVWISANYAGFGRMGGMFSRDNTCDNKRQCVRVTDNKKVRIRDARYADRLQHTSIHNEDANDVIARYDAHDTFHYCDPPYIGTSCGHYEGYSNDDYRTLLNTLNSVRGRFMLSSFPNNILTEATEKYGWTKREYKFNGGISGAKSTKTEVLVTNY